MNARTLAFGFFASLLILGNTAAYGQTDTTAAQVYALGPESRFETGCFGPCLCPILTQDLQGSFVLKHIGYDGLYDNYSVSSVEWFLPEATAAVRIQGSGTYRVGGEVAIQQQLSLDLTVGANPQQHYDSGLVPGGGEFPKIVINISVHRGEVCLDTLMHVQAAPDPPAVPTAVDESSPGATSRLVRVTPNPFGATTGIDLVLARPGAVDLAIYDLSGRAIRHIVNGAWLPAGPHVIRWDGRADRGAMCATGVYFVGARIDGRLSSRRIVKLQ